MNSTLSLVRNRYRKNREAMNAISVFQMKFNVAFTCQAAEFFLNRIAKALLRRLWINSRLKVAKLYLLILPGEIWISDHLSKISEDFLKLF